MPPSASNRRGRVRCGEGVLREIARGERRGIQKNISIHHGSGPRLQTLRVPRKIVAASRRRLADTISIMVPQHVVLRYQQYTHGGDAGHPTLPAGIVRGLSFIAPAPCGGEPAEQVGRNGDT
ncbi:hypothetical protein MRX96_025546 [Rhipicephalus microplus]